jgi:very-short-patch-repair endonuclease
LPLNRNGRRLGAYQVNKRHKLDLGLSLELGYYPISPLVGEMPGRAEGGVRRLANPSRQEHDMPHAPVPQKRRANAKLMRKAMTDAELKLWNAIRAHRLMGLSFRRQLPVGGYIVDFACPTHRLIIEVDRSQHANSHDLRYDALRTQRLEQDGWTVLRFWNDDVLKDIDNVCLHILTVAGEVRQ